MMKCVPTLLVYPAAFLTLPAATPYLKLSRRNILFLNQVIMGLHLSHFQLIQSSNTLAINQEFQKDIKSELKWKCLLIKFFL